MTVFITSNAANFHNSYGQFSVPLIPVFIPESFVAFNVKSHTFVIISLIKICSYPMLQI